MGRLGRWITLAAVLGVLAFLIILLYLILEPLHRDDDGDALAPLGITASASNGTTAWPGTVTTPTPEPLRLAPARGATDSPRPATTSSGSAASMPYAATTTRPEGEKAQATS